MNKIIQDSIEKSMSYQDYRNLVSSLVSQGKSTGEDQSEDRLNYTALNDKRMNRLDKTLKISDESKETLGGLKKEQTWVLLTESWCGDAAQTAPLINKLAEHSDKIDLKIVLRDENEELMNQFLTNGNRAIPKLILLENDSKEVLSSWGPRPTKATQMVLDYKNQHGVIDAEFKKDLQLWYNKDKGNNAQRDIIKILKDLN